MKPTYDEKHCDIHDQDYAEYLHGCPICAGEKMSGKMIKNINESKGLYETIKIN